MTRPERFRSAGIFLLYGIVVGVLLVATVYGWSELGLDDDSVIFMCLIWFLGIFTLMGLGGGIYLLMRGLACGIAQWTGRRRR